jgi:alpha-glucosidase
VPDGLNWSRSAAIYQIYIRSFADGNGDGIGDLAGVRSRLGYLADLGIDALWFNPWYRSPMADGGYDVADYTEIAPVFGSLGEAEKLIVEAHEQGIRVLIDIVPNHGSDQQAWFLAALASRPGSPERQRFYFRPGRGRDGEEPPNNWQSIFGGPAWARTTGPGGEAGEWYLHLFAPEQPDLNWGNPEVRAAFEGVLRFWFDRGADGARIDSAALLMKDETLADLPASGALRPGDHPYTDRNGVHDIYRRWRQIADSYDEPRALIGEVWLHDADRLARYLRPDELHSVFNFDFLRCAFEAPKLKRVIDAALDTHERVGALPTWVLSNHDVVRHVTRYGRPNTEGEPPGRSVGGPVDLELGTRRARAAALLTMALPGAVYIYQGEELGLWEVEELAAQVRQDPIWRRSGHRYRGRDGCRVPIPWSGERPPFGFSPDGSRPWLPQPTAWRALTVEAQTSDPGSMLELYRQLLHRRRAEPSLSSAQFSWLRSPDDVLAFRRGDDVVAIVNFSPAPVDLPAHDQILLSSAPLSGGKLPAEASVWLRSQAPTPPAFP